jgi:hypothetical protein
MAIAQIVTMALAAASANNICLSQTPGGAGALTLNGSAAAGLDYQRHVIITSAGNDSGVTFTLKGTRNDGGAVTEVITGANAGVAESTLDYKIITSVVISGAAAAGVTVGTNGIGASPWQALSQHTNPQNASIAAIITGTINIDIEYTYEDPCGVLGAFPALAVIPTAFKHLILVGVSANSDGVFDNGCWGWRVRQNSGNGSAKVIVAQQGMRS